MKRRLDFRKLGNEIESLYPDIEVWVDPSPRASWAEIRRKNLRIHIWQFGNCFPRIEASTIKPGDYIVMQSVFNAINDQRLG